MIYEVNLLLWTVCFLSVNFSIHDSIPLTATPVGKNAWILGDGVEYNSTGNTEWRELDGS
jgi:hypothetical protein